MDDVLLLFSEAQWTFLSGLSLSGLGDVQEAGLEDSMDRLDWARSWGKLPVQARAQRKMRGQRMQGEAHTEEKRWEEGQSSWEGQGSKINWALFSARNESPGFALPASGNQIPASFLQLLRPTET